MVRDSGFRVEHDSIGMLEVPADAYYGCQSLRAQRNFPMTGRRMHLGMIKNLARVKMAAAVTNQRAGELKDTKARAIIGACEDILKGTLDEAFIVDAVQGGAGTSANMNANEVVANRAIELLGGQKGDYGLIHPNDDVNMAQSTNDVYPTAGKLTAIGLLETAAQAVRALREALLDKASAFDHVIKMGRTQLQDAVPMRLGQGFHAYASALARDLKRFDMAKEALYEVNLGGTAIGTGITASRYYEEHIVPTLAELTGLPLRQAEDLFDATENLDALVFTSGVVKACALSLSKMANDLRLLSSGPRTGIGEITLPPMQNGSSIMPGKVNPVIPEVVTQAAFRIAGNDVTIGMCAEAGQLELNAFEPVLFDSLFESLTLLAQSAKTLRDNCVVGIEANTERCRALLMDSYGMVTALCPAIGYEKAAEMVKGSMREHTPIVDYVQEHMALSGDAMTSLLDPYALTEPSSLPCFKTK